jgi:hypothetical protein
MKTIDVRRLYSKNKSHHPIFLKIKPISIAKCKIFVKCVGIESKFLFKLDLPRKWKNIKYHEKNMIAISWERCYCIKIAKPMLQTSK